MPPMVSLAWLVVALPLAGFLANGWISFFRPSEKRAVSAIGVGVLVGAFVVALGVVWAAAATPVVSAYVLRHWSWMPVGPLSVDFALRVDALSSVMLLVVT